MGCGCCKERTQFRNGTPLVSGGTVTPCFTDGRLFKVAKGKRWYFYNDTQDSTMQVTAQFGPTSKIIPGEQAKVKTSKSSGECTLVLVINPLDTCELCRLKSVNGYKVTPSSTYITDKDQSQARAKAREVASKEMLKMQEIARKKKCANEHELLAQARHAGKPYVDLHFPPTDASLYRPGVDKVPQGALRDLSTFCWRRPEQYLPKSWRKRIKLYTDVAPTDIDQGLLGDCYFLCSCSALAEHSRHIKGIFANDQCCLAARGEHKRGGWRVTLNIHGWWRTFIIDSYLPSKSLLPSFARNRHHPNQLWISFLEKAYAKAYGSYQAIVAGYPWQALEDLTGFPAYSFDAQWEQATKDSKARNQLFAQLQQWNDDDYLLSIATPSPGGTSPQLRGKSPAEAEALFNKIGLATGHAYTVLDVKHFPLHGLFMLKIRNPWGTGAEWSGNWSDVSPLWKEYPLIKLACQPEKKEDGIFWMEWKDVIQYFDTGSVCFRKGHWYSSWHDYRVPGCFNALIPDIALEIIVKKTTFKAFFMLEQKDKRGLAATDPDNKYAAIMLTVAKGALEGGRMEVVANSNENPKEPSSKYLFKVSRSVAVYYTLEENTRYLIIPRRMQSSSGNNNPTKRFVLGMISAQKVSGNITANIVRLSDQCRVFANLSPFDSGRLASVEAAYQIRHGNDLFKVKKGSTLHKGATRNTQEYEQVM